MKNGRWFLLLVLALSGGWDISAEEGAALIPLAADLDRDGKLERITLVKFAETEEDGEFFQIRVMDDDGTLMWEGPKDRDTENPLVCGSWHFGVSLPELAADIDGDGFVELVVPAPQSDVSPTYYRVLRWKGDRFSPVRSGKLMEEARGSDVYPWGESEKWQGRWIQSFKGVNADGSLRVEVVEYVGETTPRLGEAHIVGDASGYRVQKWSIPLKALSDLPATGPVDPTGGGGGVVYRARLGTGDHFNSSGVRLDSVSAILRQDRANYHKGNGDEEDGSDPVFRTPGSRERMDALSPVPVGADVAAWREAIVKGTPLVEVEVTPEYLKVQILR